MKKLILLLLFASILITPVYAETFIQKRISNAQECSSNTTLVKNQTWMFNNGSLTSFSTNEVCPYGCNEMLNSCNASPFIQNTILILILLLVALIIFKLI